MNLVPLACSVVVLAAVPAAAQDPAKVASTSYKVLAENERVRVLRVTMPSQAEAPMHEHPAHVAVSLSDATVHLTLPDGKSMDVEMTADSARLQPPGKHASANSGTAPLDVVLVELKAAPGNATLPSTRPGAKMKILVDDPRVMVYRVSFDPSFHEPAGTTHDYDQVVIPLGPGDVKLTVNNETTSSWKRGDVRLIGRGVAHESQAGQQSGDIIIVAVR